MKNSEISNILLTDKKLSHNLLKKCSSKNSMQALPAIAGSKSQQPNSEAGQPSRLKEDPKQHPQTVQISLFKNKTTKNMLGIIQEKQPEVMRFGIKGRELRGSTGDLSSKQRISNRAKMTSNCSSVSSADCSFSRPARRHTTCSPATTRPCTKTTEAS